MKTIYTCLLLLATNFILAQKDSIPKNSAGYFEYTDIVQVDSASSQSLYSKSKLWVVNSFVSGKDVTQLNDDESKTVVVKGLMPVYIQSWVFKQKIYIKMKFSIFNKDNKYKYSLTDMSLMIPAQGTALRDAESPLEKFNNHMTTKKQYADILDQAHKQSTELIASLKRAMTSKDDSW